MIWILRSSFHGILSEGTMLITVTGSKTGRKYTLPVGYYHEGEFLWVMTSRDRSWWRNLKCGSQVELLLKRNPVKGFAEVEEKDVEARIGEYLQHIPQSAGPLGIHVENGMPCKEDIQRAAQERLFVKIKI